MDLTVLIALQQQREIRLRGKPFFRNLFLREDTTHFGQSKSMRIHRPHCPQRPRMMSGKVSCVDAEGIGL